MKIDVKYPRHIGFKVTLEKGVSEVDDQLAKDAYFKALVECGDVTILAEEKPLVQKKKSKE